MKEEPIEQACTRCGASTKGILDGVAICDSCYSVFGACCASEFEPVDLLCKSDKPVPRS